MVQFIEFYVTAHNTYSAERVRYVLDTLIKAGSVKTFLTREDSETTYFSITGTWPAYSTIAAIIPKSITSENSLISISIEHFEDDN
jgi:hypothetical protein